MKKFIIIRFTVALLIAVAVLFWPRDKHLSDAQIRRRAVGTWTNNSDGASLLLCSDGSFLDQRPSSVTNRVNSWAGTWRLEGGCIVKFMTNIDVGRYAQLYKIPRYRVFQLNGQKMVYQLEGDINAPRNLFTVVKQ